MASRRKSIFENVSDLAGLGAEETETVDPVLDLSCKPSFPNSPHKPTPHLPSFPTGSVGGGGGGGMLEQWALLSRMMELASAAQVQAGLLAPHPALGTIPWPALLHAAVPPATTHSASTGVRGGPGSARSPEFPAIASAPNSNGTVLVLADKGAQQRGPRAPAAFALPPHPPAAVPSAVPSAASSPGAGSNSGSSRQAPRFQCPDCSRSYSTFSGLSKHRQFHCTSQLKRQFACKYCEKEYSSLGALKMHIRTHTLPCKCGVCGKAFSRPWLLQGHLRTHTGEKPFRCGHCGRSFADRSNLRAHLQTHSDVKKYRCGACSKTFSRMSLLHKHEANGCPANLVLPS